MDMHAISVWFVCKLCGYTFHFQNVSEFLEHKRQKHYKEFVKIRCIVFKENDDHSHDAVDPVSSTDIIDVDGDEIDLHKEELKFILTTQQEPLPSNIINSNRDNRDLMDPKIFNSYVRVKRLTRKESETAKSATVKENNNPGIPNNVISKFWKFEIQTSQTQNFDDNLHTQPQHSNSIPPVTTDSISERNLMFDSLEIPSPHDAPNSPTSDSDLQTKTESLRLRIIDAVDPNCYDGDGNRNNMSPHLKLDHEASIDLELNIALSTYENKCIDISADFNDIHADNEPANVDHYDISAERKPEAQLIENIVKNIVDEKSKQGSVDYLLNPYVLVKRLHLTALAVEPVKEPLPNISDADDCDQDPTYGPQSEINSDSDNSIDREPPTKKRRQKSPHVKKRSRINYFTFPLQETHSEDESNAVMALSDWLINLKSVPLICIDKADGGDITTTSEANIILLDPDPTSEAVGDISMDRPIKCRLCCAKLTSEQQLKIHVKHCWLLNKRRHRYCIICEKTLSKPRELKRHSITKHGTDKEKAQSKLILEFECQVCSRKLVSRQNLRLHMNTHINRSERLRPFVCKVCGKTYSYNVHLKYHLMAHHEKTFFKCTEPNCTRTYTILHNLRVHQKLHLKLGQKIRPYTCTKPYVFPPESNEISGPLDLTLSDWLKEQTIISAINDNPNVILLDPDPTINDVGPVTEENPILCKLCYKNLVSESEVRVHVQNCWHRNKYLHRYCTLCKKLFTTNIRLKIHNVLAHGTEEQNLSRLKFKCDQCPKEYLNRQSFEHHLLRSHKNTEQEVKFNYCVCEICGSRFRTPALLALHLLIHNDNRLFKCTYLNCSKTFNYKSNLRVHLQTHSDLRNYKCSYKDCNKTFKTSKAVNTHSKSHTPKPRVQGQYPCTHDNCGTILSSSKGLKNHVLSKHPPEGHIAKPVECEICHKKFPFKQCLSRHSFVHKQDKPFQCTEEGCSAAFKFASQLVEHKRIHTGEQPYQCDTCGKAYAKHWSFRKHIRVHTNAHNQHSCHLCQRKFPGSWELKQHLLIHEKGKQFVCQQCGQQCMTKANLKGHEKSHSKLTTAGKRGKSRKQKKKKRDEAYSEAEENE